jgi:hypothetical protein
VRRSSAACSLRTSSRLVHDAIAPRRRPSATTVGRATRDFDAPVRVLVNLRRCRPRAEAGGGCPPHAARLEGRGCGGGRSLVAAAPAVCRAQVSAARGTAGTRGVVSRLMIGYELPRPLSRVMRAFGLASVRAAVAHASSPPCHRTAEPCGWVMAGDVNARCRRGPTTLRARFRRADQSIR